MLIDGHLYGSGDTRKRAVADSHDQITGATPALRASMVTQAHIVAVSAERASDVAEMRDADAIAWSDIVRQAMRSPDGEEEEVRFLNF